MKASEFMALFVERLEYSPERALLVWMYLEAFARADFAVAVEIYDRFDPATKRVMGEMMVKLLAEGIL